MKLGILFVLLTAICVAAQDEWKPDKKEPGKFTTDHLIRQYDKFKDVTITMSRPDDVTVKWGKKKAAAAFSISYLRQKPNEPVTELFLALSPNAVSIAGNMANEAFKHDVGFWDRYKTNWLHFQGKAEVVLLVGGERFKLQPTDKPFGLDGGGQFQESVGTILPLEIFRKMTAAPEWEMLVGDIVIAFQPQDKGNLAKRVQPHLLALAAELNK